MPDLLLLLVAAILLVADLLVVAGAMTMAGMSTVMSTVAQRWRQGRAWSW